jgi:nucleolar MIF4G domain-containing protein 1
VLNQRTGSGPQLRQDDPSALKDIVLLIQPAVARVGEAALSVRTKFMIETITDLKNNRVKTGVTTSNLNSEHITKMRKILGSLNSRNIRATEPIRVSRMDIHDSSKKGKWWLIGASWKDDPLVAARQELHNLPSNLDQAPLEDSEGEPDLLSIAKALRMNTGVRRSIFVAIMSATDYRDAHVRLLKLRLKRNQEYEIPRVLVHCAMEEDVYNPYYMLIARRLCGEMGRRIKMSFMFTLWDMFRKMGERGDLGEHEDRYASDDEDSTEANKLASKSMVNLAKLYGNLVANGSLTLGILKNLNFAYLQPKTSMFVELLVITIIQLQEQQPKQALSHSSPSSQTAEKQKEKDKVIDEKTLQRIFQRAQETPQMINGLLYFIRKVVSKTDLIPSSERGLQRVAFQRGCKVAANTLRTVLEGGELD